MASAFFKPGGATAMAKAKAKQDAETALKKEADRENLRPWVEKYRPKTIRDVSSQDHAVKVLESTLSHSNLPHMLFYGPPGTGKTSTILALARELFGPELIKSRVLELNASDERGITIVREKIKNFAKSVVTQAVPGYPCPPFKIIILDEADSMTQDAQNALRRTMEVYSKITRFCLICNYVTRIIEPLTSRCSKFRFKPLSTDSTRSRIEYIAEREGVQCDDGVVDTIIKTSDGDMRRAITYMQSASRLHKSEAVTSESIQEIAGVVPDHVVERLVEGCAQKSFNGVQEAVQSIAYDGYSATQVLLQLHEAWIMSPTVAPLHKAKIALAMGETDKCLSDGADEYLQMLNLCLNVQKILQV